MRAVILFVVLCSAAAFNPLRGQRNKQVLEDIKNVVYKLSDQLAATSGPQTTEALATMDTKIQLISTKTDRLMATVETLKHSNHLIVERLDRLEAEFAKVHEHIEHPGRSKLVDGTQDTQEMSEMEAFTTATAASLSKSYDIISKQYAVLQSWKDEQDKRMKKMMNVMTYIYEALKDHDDCRANETINRSTSTDSRSGAVSTAAAAEFCESAVRKTISERCSVIEYGLDRKFNLSRLERIITDKIEQTALQVMVRLEDATTSGDRRPNVGRPATGDSNNGIVSDETGREKVAFMEVCDVCHRLDNKFEFFVRKLESKLDRPVPPAPCPASNAGRQPEAVYPVPPFGQATAPTVSNTTIASVLAVGSPNVAVVPTVVPSNDLNTVSDIRGRVGKCRIIGTASRNNERSLPDHMMGGFKSGCDQYNPNVYFDGTYIINVGGSLIRVFCDIENGQWTVIMRRGPVDDAAAEQPQHFNHTWAAYKFGFGDLESEFWLGLDNIHKLTSSGAIRLKVDLEFRNGTCMSLYYDHFFVDNEKSGYKLTLDKPKDRSARAFVAHSGQVFSTEDRSAKNLMKNCAAQHGGGWWYIPVKCFNVLLTGSEQTPILGQKQRLVIWGSYEPIKSVQMSVRPTK